MPRHSGYYNKLPKARQADVVDPADVLQVYRPDPTGKFGGTGGIETLPTTVSRSDAYELASILKAAREAGMPELTPQQLANMILLEGRGDAGGSYYSYNNPKYKGIETLLSKQFPENRVGPAFAATVREKADTAKRTGLPFDMLWNGTGKIPGTNWGGAEYNQRAKAFKESPALQHPKNAEFMDFLNRAYEGKLTPEELARAQIQSKEELGTHLGGYGSPNAFKFMLTERLRNDPNALKALHGISPNALMHVAHNIYREAKGIPTKPHGSYQIYSFPRRQSHARATEMSEAEMAMNLPSIRAIIDPMMGIERPPKEQTMMDKLKSLLKFAKGGYVADAGNGKLI
jgi:hypothetical protein